MRSPRVWGDAVMAEAEAGFDHIPFYGGYEPKRFDADTRGNLLLVARKRKASP